MQKKIKKVLTDENYYSNKITTDGVVAELVDAPDSKSGFFGSESSILSGPTIKNKKGTLMVLFLFLKRYNKKRKHCCASFFC